MEVFNKILVSLFSFAAVFAAITILLQDLSVFPGAFVGKIVHKAGVPPEVAQLFIKGKGGKNIEVWRVLGKNHKRDKKYIALTFNGNGAAVSEFIDIQLWFRDLGITSYSMNYRGYGETEGYPTDRGILSDAEMFVEDVLKRENITPDQLVVFGFSLGNGPASHVAQKYQVHTLLALCSYISIKDSLNDRGWFKYLSPFLWTNFTPQLNIGKLDKTCLIVVHGERDEIFPVYHAEQNYAAYRGSGKTQYYLAEGVDHNGLFFSTRKRLTEMLENCVAENVGQSSVFQ